MKGWEKHTIVDWHSSEGYTWSSQHQFLQVGRDSVSYSIARVPQPTDLYTTARLTNDATAHCPAAKFAGMVIAAGMD